MRYYGYRYYSPTNGRWVRKDPSGISGGLSLYVFCINNPTYFIDPLGLRAGDEFTSMREAAYDFGKTYNAISIREKREYGSAIYRLPNGMYTYSYPDKGDPISGDEVSISAPPGTYMVLALVHTHGHYIDLQGDIFSPDDKAMAAEVIPGLKTGDTKIYLINPKGEFLVYDPSSGPTGPGILISSDMDFDSNHPLVKKLKEICEKMEGAKK